jgi:hypothetical protein
MGRVLYPWTNRAEKTYRFCQKHKSLTLHLSLSLWSPSVNQFRLQQAQKHNGAQLQPDWTQQRITMISRAHKTQLHLAQHIFFNWNTSVVGQKHLTVWPFVAPQLPVSNVGDFRLAPGCAEVLALLGFHIASVGSCLSKFRDLDCLTIEDVTYEVLRNVDNQPTNQPTTSAA